MKIFEKVHYSKEYEQDQFNEAVLVHRIFLGFAALYLLFGIADFYYARAHFTEFFILRLLYCIVPVSIFLTVKKAKSFRQTEFLAFFHGTIAAGIITYMVGVTEGTSSPYYAGINLVGILGLCFFTFSRTFFWMTALSIYGPYFILAAVMFRDQRDVTPLVLHTFFIFGTVGACALIHHFRERYRLMNVEYRGALQLELQNRNEIIKKKTEEAVNLSALSSQFSPQIVESIRSGKINLKAGAERAQICTMFIDIVNSTERVTRIDKDKVEKVLSKFLDDTIKTMLKYDITVDKFLGDGVLGFCNAPLKRQDFVSRVITAALEIREKIKQDQNFYERNWQKELQIRVGIAKGFANVGFYGSQKYFRSYTGIGPVMNMASRLCSAAEPSQIVVDNDVFEDCQNEFETIALGKKTLKGFEQDTIFVYEIVGSKQQNAFMPGVNDCPKCGSLMTLESNSQGHFIFTCKSCCSVITDQELTEKRDAA